MGWSNAGGGGNIEITTTVKDEASKPLQKISKQIEQLQHGIRKTTKIGRASCRERV